MRKPIRGPLEDEMRNSPTFEVAKWAHASQKGSFRQIAAELELERRKYLREFFTKRIVSWIALGVSVVSLIISIAR
ncbi:MAG: hypothetical protein Q7V56_07300 [Gammaproteobacteria bacterium]|nr:hypothetical protein [Gammaproteobacteria bacterium]